MSKYRGASNPSLPSLKERLADAQVYDREVIRSLDNAYSATGGIAILSGNLAPDGAVVKAAGVKPEMSKYRGASNPSLPS